jgi:hypothetical protein
MDGTAVRKALSGTAAAIVLPIVLLGGLSACTAIPNTTASPTPSASASPTPTATPTPTRPGRQRHRDAIGDRVGALSGAWMGTWTNETPAAVGTFTLTWAQQGTLLVGAIGVTGSNCISAGNVTGNVDGTKISFGAVEGTKTITVRGYGVRPHHVRHVLERVRAVQGHLVRRQGLSGPGRLR